MKRTERAVVLLIVQAAMVLSIAGKYLYERKTSPRIWVRTAQVDPNTPLRGRYLALQLAVDACGLRRDRAYYSGPIVGSKPPDPGFWRWAVRSQAKNGKLVAVPAADTDRPEQIQEVTLWGARACDHATLSGFVDFFVPDTTQSPLPTQPGQELWVEVTVPPMGPPRPIQLATSQNGAFTPLSLR